MIRVVLFAALALASVTATTVAGAAEKKYVSQEGHWVINVAESKVPAEGFKLPLEPFDVTKDDGKTLEFTTYKTNAKGELEVAFKYAGAYDGKPYPAGPGATSSYQHITAAVSYTETRVANGMVFSERLYMLDGGKKYRLEATCLDDNGKKFDYVLAYDKVEKK